MVRGRKICFEVNDMVRSQIYGSRSKIWFEVKDTVRGKRIWFKAKDIVRGQRYNSRSKIWFEVKDMVKDGLRLITLFKVKYMALSIIE